MGAFLLLYSNGWERVKLLLMVGKELSYFLQLLELIKLLLMIAKELSHFLQLLKS